jgi:hypothetical protein
LSSSLLSPVAGEEGEGRGEEEEEEDGNLAAAEAKKVEVEEEAEDPCTLPHNTTTHTHTHTPIDWTFHILYSDVYATPTLWFRAARADGVPLTGDEIAALLKLGVDVCDGGAGGDGAGEERVGVGVGVGAKVGGGQQQQQERWTVLSQDEHPLLGSSYYFLHPCGTPARMAHLVKVEKEKENEEGGEERRREKGLVYLVKWFGLVAPLLGLPFPMQFCQRVIGCGVQM